MSCQIILTANIQDVNLVRSCLFSTDDHRGSESWLQHCEVSVSPTGDLIVIANERKIVVLTSKWDSQSSLIQYQITHSSSLHSYDKVKAVLCLPILSDSEISQIGPDWICILVAYDSGYVRFYTENCELLMEEQLHNENITSVKCQSQHTPGPDISPNIYPEEIYIQYQSNVCIINGPHLFPLLRDYRNLLVTGQSTSDFTQPGLATKKWSFYDQSVINDCSVVGSCLTTPFDHLVTASVCGGFEAKYRATPPNNSLVLAAGSKPFLGWHLALEGGSQPMLSDVAKAVATKLKSALPGWLMGNKSQLEKQMSVAMQPPEAMGCRFGMCDLRRTATNIILSSDRKLAAVSDALGRVLLVDTFKGVVVRIFKGYRDAQCSFIQVPEEKKSKHRIGSKVARFLVIYSPKKGTVEVFPLLQGARICTFTASKHSRLIYINYGLMGFTIVPKSKYVCQFTTLFIDNDGKIKEILIPFHFALSEKNSKRARDIHLYRKLRHLLKSTDCLEEKVLNESYNTCAELKTIEVKSQVIEMLINTKNCTAKVMLQCVQYFVDNIAEKEGNNLKSLCENVRNLLGLYLFVTSGDKLDRENGNVDENKNTLLNLEAKEMKNLQTLLDLSTMNDSNHLKEVHVSFSDNSKYTPSEFLMTFDATKSGVCSLKSNIDESIIFRTSEIIFKPYVTGELVNFEELQNLIIQSNIDSRDLFGLLVNYWVNRSLHIDLNLEKEMHNLSILIYTLVKSVGKKHILADYDKTCLFWAKIREVLADSYRPFPALIAAILCKHIAEKVESEIRMNDSSTSLEDEGMEVLSQENVQWSLLIGKLEDVSLLNIILSARPIVTDCPLPKLKYERVNISLKYVLDKGKGCVSELVSQWLTTSGVDPANIAINQNEENVSTTDTQVGKADISKEEKLFEQLILLRSKFPYSVEASTLVANMTWEYALAWQKDIQNLGNLEAAIKCLNFIQHIQIKQGLYQLVWNAHLKIVNEGACKLINKVGKLPKERLCRQDTGLSDHQISLFIGITTNFLYTFMDVAIENCNTSPIDLKFENIWENQTRESLVELAAQKRQVNYDLLHLHYQLSLVLQMITTFAVKHTKPVSNLFEASVVNLLFTDFQRKIQVNWNKSDIKINSSRMEFLSKIVTASLESVTMNENGRIHSTEHVAWTAKCFTLARFWNLDIDIIKRYQIVQLFTNGFDSLAEELIPAVNDTNTLGLNLLVVAAKRLSQFLTLSPDLSKNISALSPALTQYIETLDDEWCALSSLSSISNLARHVMRYLTEDQSEHEYKLAELLLLASTTLEEIQS